MGLIWSGNYGQYLDSATGKPADPAAAQGPLGLGVRPDVRPDANPFLPDYMAQHPDKFQANPFQPGTREYNDFQKSQISNAVDQAGQPNKNSWNSLIDEKTGLLNGNLQAKSYGIDPSVLSGMEGRLDKIQLNKDPLKALEAEGTRSGPSAWANLMGKQVEDKKLAALDNVGAQAQGANAGALSSLAMRGGLNSGARTSLAKSMQHDINAGSQNVRRGADSDLLNVGLQDETKRMDVLKQLPGMEIASLAPEMDKANSLNNANLGAAQFNASQDTGANKFNIQNSINETLQKRGYDVNNYNQLMQAWGAGKTADATSSGGKK